MTSRLERLVLLLDTGSASGIRSTAAQQLGDIMKQHPNELKNLLSRVSVHLRSNSWETRIAAGQAIGAIAKNATSWNPDVKVEGMPLPEANSKSVLSFKDFDIEDVMMNGKRLLGSAGNEYDLNLSDMNPAERKALVKKNLFKTLGMDMQFLDGGFLDDIDTTLINNTKTEAEPPRPPSPEKIDMSLSARERNRLRRKNKKEAKEKATEARKRASLPQRVATIDSHIRDDSVKPESDPNDNKVIIESKVSLEVVDDPREWPFEEFCETLCIDIFDPNWVIRHGAAIGLREILKYHGKDAGKCAGLSSEKNQIMHEEWLADVCVRLLCVFALDRFGDFVSDQAVAPVRETCSQTLGTLAQFLPPEQAYSAQQCLLKLIFQEKELSLGNYKWEARHAGLLGLKYLIAVRTDLVESLLNNAIKAIILGLKDDDDDVRAVSASCLLPVTDQFVKLMPDKAVEVSTLLWDNLRDMKDDLSASTGSIMDLIAKLFSYSSILSSFKKISANDPDYALDSLVPILFPFFRHTISSVRLAVLTTLKLFVSTDSEYKWLDDRVFFLVFQNILVEERLNILNESESLWSLIINKVSPNQEIFIPLIRGSVSKWLASIMTPLGVPIDEKNFYLPKALSNQAGEKKSGLEAAHNIDIAILMQDFSLVSKEVVIRNRLRNAKALGTMMKLLPFAEVSSFLEGLLIYYIRSNTAIHQQLSAIIIEEWVTDNPIMDPDSPFKESLSAMFDEQLEKNKSITFSECFPHLKGLRSECLALLNTATMEGGVDPSIIPPLPNLNDTQSEESFTVETCKYFMTAIYDKIIIKAQKNSIRSLEDRKERVTTAIGAYMDFVSSVERQVSSAIVCAMAALNVLPPKLNHIIGSITASVKFEPNLELQTRSAIGLVRLIELFSVKKPKKDPIEKIVKNLRAYIVGDVTTTPVLEENLTKEGIYSLITSHVPVIKSRGRPAVYSINNEASKEDQERKLIRRGSELCFEHLCLRLGPNLFKVVPSLWDYLFEELRSLMSSDIAAVNQLLEQDLTLAQAIVDRLQVLSIIVQYIDSSLHNEIKPCIPWVLGFLQVSFSIIRYQAAKCFACLSDVLLSPCMNALISTGLPLMMDPKSVLNRQGYSEAVYFIVQTLDTKILPYVIFLVVPVMGRMSDNNDHVRLISSNCFALLINLIPLESGIPDPEDFPKELIEQRFTERKFIGQLLDARQVEPFKIPIEINAELRSYQQEGVNWLAFLNKYQLHGILCDDMGLGKTLQSICILASDHYLREKAFKETGNPDQAHIPSLVICPPTLIGHWYHELKNYANNLNPLCYSGIATERKKIIPSIPKHDVIILSYDIIRNDINELCKYNWNYCILDEGHLIKNGKTKITKAIKQLKANHRLILSGTPIQNNVLELWSLFDFLMPGFLGSEKSFNERYSKPILASREAKSSSKEQEAGALALEALHKQVLPFLLRRLKEDVLDDLPPKIIQDYYCDLGEVQKQLYDDFSRSQSKTNMLGSVSDSGTGEVKKTPHIFQSLQYLRKLCNHPLLVITPKHPQLNNILKKVGDLNKLHELVHAPKLLALKQLLNDCGIGVEGTDTATEDQIVSGAVSQHRALIFFQHKVMMDLVESDLLKAHLPNVTYLKLDGGVDHLKRHDMVQKFNQDPSIDLLLLTTHVGGLGLNLTGADTVIFVEHDWNPSKDMQAMDRAHRIGQKKVVNVYRLIARDTLEEKIMGLQKFKMNIAKSVVNQQNSSIDSMETSQLFDLFSAPAATTTAPALKLENGEEKLTAGLGGPSLKALEGLEKLWDEKQYEEEFDLDQFISNLNTS